jgi:hypothetical protein
MSGTGGRYWEFADVRASGAPKVQHDKEETGKHGQAEEARHDQPAHGRLHPANSILH